MVGVSDEVLVGLLVLFTKIAAGNVKERIRGFVEAFNEIAKSAEYRMDTFNFRNQVMRGALPVALGRKCKQAERVLLDLDCDVFDAAYFPAATQARPFGINPLFLLQLLNVVDVQRLVGFAISEYDPARDAHDRCLETLMWLIEYVLLLLYE